MLHLLGRPDLLGLYLDNLQNRIDGIGAVPVGAYRSVELCP